MQFNRSREEFRPCRPLDLVAVFCVVLLNLTFASNSNAEFIPVTAPPSIEVTKTIPPKWVNLPAFGFFPPSPASCPTGVNCKFESDMISDVALSSYEWSLNKEVKVTFRSTHKFLLHTVLSVELFRLDDRSSETDSIIPSYIPRHVRVGVILDKYPLSLPNRDYTLKFTPPSFLRSGRYLLIMTHFQRGHVTNFDSIQVPIVTGVSFDRRVPINHLVSVGSKSDGQHDAGMEGSNEKTATMNDLPIDIVRNFINSMVSTVDVCALCSTSKSLRSNCDYILAETTFSSDVRLPDPIRLISLPQPSSQNNEESQVPAVKLSTSKICRLADLEILLQQLEFKYISLFRFNTVQPHDFPHPINQLKALVPTHKDGNGIQLWAYPNLYFHLTSQLALRYNFLVTFFDNLFDSVFYQQVGKIEISNGEGQITLDELKIRLQKLKILPTMEPFVKQLATKISVQLTLSGLKVYSTNSMMAPLKVLQPTTLPPMSKISLFDKWMTKPLHQRTEILREIFEF
ncbi:hypothetical protein BKA69DRAFT_1100075 [Paraphysoderma sedebokerense]|nr:hypothetical protein BKA69DRAFT_1100075 [Paraphysoderma sedebokerense]